ncbi:hypothetical protein H632_c91p1 [Helicosporidium sp. ATCC 50920]|nr:hypothetical protein H632_c91p1 [Helicosporidium sp. ATCC 50920]|eukprot:KDD76835.1 hypothetical protein H632_c91p1 [Helicosporidium sp. ATCC 50920]
MAEFLCASEGSKFLLQQARVAVLGASGYTGSEVVRLLSCHPSMRVTTLTGNREAGRPLSAVFPHLTAAPGANLDLVKIEDVDWSGVDAALCCLPHGTTQRVVAGLPPHIKVVDLSADFRLFDPALYEEWYGAPHAAVDLQKSVVYGLTERHRAAVRGARVVANPGCYPTCVQLAVAPLLEARLISTQDLIVDAKSGVSGAGRSAKVNLLYTEQAEGMRPYGVGRHRHMPEIEQGLGEAAGEQVRVSFTPHLVPMTRGMEADCYVRLSEGRTAQDLHDTLQKTYADEPFVTVLSRGEYPATQNVKGTNHCQLAVFPDRLPGRAVVVSVIDNLVKGASGQAIQNLNLMLGLPETMGLQQHALFP